MLLANSGSIMHGSMKRIMDAAARRAGVAYRRATVIGKSSTVAATIHLAREGIPTVGIGICRRYSHSPVETMDLNDAVGGVQWLLALVETMGEHDTRAFSFLG